MAAASDLPETLGPFLTELLNRHPDWRLLPIVERSGPGWNGHALIVPPPDGSDLSGSLDIEEVADEITISFDHSHVHMTWPTGSTTAAGTMPSDSMAMIDAILTEKVVASSGWIDGRVRIGSIHETEQSLNLLLSKLQHIRVRSWLGQFDRDEQLL
jgi:hypothetical protein